MFRGKQIQSQFAAHDDCLSGIQLRTFISLLGVLFLSHIRLGAADSSVSKEYQIKAAFLYNFTKFVEWPRSRFPDDSSPIVIGVLGQNPFGDELEKIVHDRKVNGRGIAIKIIDSPAEAAAVHVLFVKEGGENYVTEMEKQPYSGGILTVGESEKFMSSGGMISFNMAADKVRFEISVKAAEKSGLKISAQLQKLATRVERSP